MTQLNSTGTGLIYSTFLGGSDDDEGRAIAVGPLGRVYVTGETRATDFPTTPPVADFPILAAVDPTFGGGCCEAFVTKLDPDPTGPTPDPADLIYSTFLGGSGGDTINPEGGFGIAVDVAGSAFVTGRTDSPTFPLAGAPLQPAFVGFGLLSDGFVAKISFSASHFLCYRVGRTKGTPKFDPITSIPLTDQFESKPFKVRRPLTLCNPATKNGEVPEDLDTHLVGYKIRRATGQPRHERRFFIKVVDQFGTIFVNTKRPDRLLVPSAKNLVSTPDAPEFLSHNVDQLQVLQGQENKAHAKV